MAGVNVWVGTHIQQPGLVHLFGGVWLTLELRSPLSVDYQGRCAQPFSRGWSPPWTKHRLQLAYERKFWQATPKHSNTRRRALKSTTPPTPIPLNPITTTLITPVLVSLPTSEWNEF